MNKLLLTAFSLTASLLITTASAADNDNLVDERPAAPKSPTQQHDLNTNSDKKASNKSNAKKSTYQKTKSKDKGMHIEDEMTDIRDNEPVDSIETKSPSPAGNDSKK